MAGVDSLQSYWNGRWLPHSDVHLSLDDVGFTWGVTAVERMRTYGGHPFQLDRHLHRFGVTIRGLQLDDLPEGPAQRQLIRELLQRNEAWVQQQREVAIVLLATPGTSPLPNNLLRRHEPEWPAVEAKDDDRSTFIAYLLPIPFPLVERRLRGGQPVTVSEIVQPPEQCWPRHWKVRSRLHYFLADRQARQRDADALGILLDTDQSITETSICNLAIVRNERIFSPPADRVLPGVTQAVAEAIAAELKIGWEKRPLSVAETAAADEILLFGTTTGIWSGWLLERTPAAAAERPQGRQTINGPIFRTLRNRFEDFCRTCESGEG